MTGAVRQPTSGLSVDGVEVVIDTALLGLNGVERLTYESMY